MSTQVCLLEMRPLPGPAVFINESIQSSQRVEDYLSLLVLLGQETGYFVSNRNRFLTVLHARKLGAGRFGVWGGLLSASKMLLLCGEDKHSVPTWMKGQGAELVPSRVRRPEPW